MGRQGHLNIKWDRGKLTRLYWGQGLSTVEIAKQYGVVRSAVSQAMQRLGIPCRTRSEARIGERCYRWKGGCTITPQGYTMIYYPTHPRAQRNKYVAEHILVWEEANGKTIPKGWIIHHINGIKGDNRASNLIAMPNKKHDILIAALTKRIQELEARLRGQTILC